MMITSDFRLVLYLFIWSIFFSVCFSLEDIKVDDDNAKSLEEIESLPEPKGLHRRHYPSSYKKYRGSRRGEKTTTTTPRPFYDDYYYYYNDDDALYYDDNYPYNDISYNKKYYPPTTIKTTTTTKPQIKISSRKTRKRNKKRNHHNHSGSPRTGNSGIPSAASSSYSHRSLHRNKHSRFHSRSYDLDDEYYYDDDEDDYDDKIVSDESKRRQGYGYSGDDGGGGIANPLALLVAPLAGIALLTAAVAVALNPVMVTVTTGRKKRAAPELEDKAKEFQVLEKFLGTIPDNEIHQQKILSMYLSCSGYTHTENLCIDRLVCEYANKNSTNLNSEERSVISIVLYHILSNDFVPTDFKNRLKTTARTSRNLYNNNLSTSKPKQECNVRFGCPEIDNFSNGG